MELWCLLSYLAEVTETANSSPRSHFWNSDFS